MRHHLSSRPRTSRHHSATPLRLPHLSSISLTASSSINYLHYKVRLAFTYYLHVFLLDLPKFCSAFHNSGFSNAPLLSQPLTTPLTTTLIYSSSSSRHSRSPSVLSIPYPIHSSTNPSPYMTLVPRRHHAHPHPPPWRSHHTLDARRWLWPWQSLAHMVAMM